MALYGLVAAASPTALFATLAVLTSRRGQVNGILFVVGLVLAQAATVLVAYALCSTVSQAEHRIVNAYAELAAGLELIAIGFTGLWRHQPRGSRSPPCSSPCVAPVRQIAFVALPGI
jgi:threonine/homoserine/homoserine lactone efflux protein